MKTTKPKKPSTRTCIVCRKQGEKTEFIRIIRTADGKVSIDESSKANGRGAYVCPNEGCIEGLKKSKIIERSLKISGLIEDRDTLIKDLQGRSLREG